MTDILLDTNIVSEVTRLAPHDRVTAWLAAQAPKKLFLCSVTMGELQRGVTRLAPGRRRDELQRWIARDLAIRFEGRILPFDREAAHLWGEVMGRGDREGKPRPLLDIQIAAIALRHGMILATRNKNDFGGLGLKLIDPWN